MEAGSAHHILRLDFTVADLERTQAFYRAIGFEAVGTLAVDEVELRLLGLPVSRARRLTMRLGRQTVGFTTFDPPGRPYPTDSTSTDLWFQHIAIAVSDMAAAHRLIINAGATPITRDGPETLPADTGGVTAFKFRDPDGHPLELLAFPPGLGAARWHERSGATPMLGIDHTAIAVGDAEASRRFYARLGFRAAGASTNRGVAQQRLDDVADDRVAVVPLHLPEMPPHLELLGYAVGRRRPMPGRSRADDVWATRTWLEVPTLSGAAITLDDGRRATSIEDPDRHAIVLSVPTG